MANASGGKDPTMAKDPGKEDLSEAMAKLYLKEEVLPFNNMGQKLKKFVETMKKREYYDVLKKKTMKVEYENNVPAPCGVAVNSNQGVAFTCSSHSVGKAIVEILNDFGLQCNQNKIIETLENTIHPDKDEGFHIEYFHFKPIVIEVWEEEDPQSKLPICLAIYVQTQKERLQVIFLTVL